MASLPIRIGVIGSHLLCGGGRGVGAARNAMAVAEDVNVVALADFLPDQVRIAKDEFAVSNSILPGHSRPVHLPNARCFAGFDAYQRVLEIPEVNYVILCPPAHFRPAYLRAAIEAGKHVFVERPVAVDAPGVRMVIEAGKLARARGLGILAGTVRRHQANYIETVRRLQDGAIGEFVVARTYWNQGVMFSRRQPDWSDMEWQLRNPRLFTWLSGDPIVSLHADCLDVINWVLQAHPLRASGSGGRFAQEPLTPGDGFDYFSVEYEYPNGMRLFSQCRTIDGCADRVGEFIAGAHGESDCARVIRCKGQPDWRFKERLANPYEQEHRDFIESLRRGEPLNDAQAIAESTLTAILGREAAYSGRTIEWDAMLNSQRRLGPDHYDWGDLPTTPPPLPGQFKFF